MDVEERVHSAPWRWSLLLSVVVLNICLPSLVLSYGTLLAHGVSYGLPLGLGVCTPAILVLTFCLSQCWCRDAADSWGGPTGYRVMAAAGLMLIVASLVMCAFLPFHLQPFIYGILGGLGSSIISAQVDAVVFDCYDTRLAIVRGLSLIGQAVGLSIFPHLITSLVENYGYSMSYIVLSAVMLQALPAILLLKSTDIKRPTTFSRYNDLAKSYAIFSNDTVNNFYSNELHLQDMSKSWRSPSGQSSSEDEMDDIYDGDDHVNTAAITPPPSPEEKRRNIFGVEILPEIPEETEDSDDNKSDINASNNQRRKFSNAIKRLSTIGDNFDEYIGKQTRRDSNTESSNRDEYSEIDITHETIAPITEIRREKVFNSFSFRCQSAYASVRRSLWMPSYRIYRFRRRTLYLMYNINDTFIKPLTRSLVCWRFYPALLLSFTRLMLITVFMALLPLTNLNMKPKTSMIETNFILSLMGFTWISFMLTTPWLAHIPKRNCKYLSVIGLSIITAACYVIAETYSHDAFSIACVITGTGFGALLSSWESAAQDFIGVHKWSKVRSTLETLSGMSVAGFTFGLIFLVPLEEPGGFHLCLTIISYTLTAVLSVWFIIAVISLYILKVRSLRTRLNCFS
ncbi:uncharacterized protein LOC105398009 [Plutella xylostella]|uniref:uncharacterized protein LOC105398009 n=1 Tax=Plutella xylostella TaxID=51655 RepID=UPI002032B3FC|nr:uncharacterized protein LOC105398009 [Plutella xylostella]